MSLVSDIVRQSKYLWRIENSTKRARVRWIAQWTIELTEDALDKRGLEWYAPEWGVLNALGGLSCAVVGHDPTTDHCGIPDHDYCEVCMQRTPGQAQTKARGNL